MTEKLTFTVNSKKRKHLSWNRKCFLCLLPELIGLFVFYLFPFGRIVYYSLIDNQFHKKFVGAANYLKTLQNEYFVLAMKNSLLLILLAIPFLMLSVLFMAFIVGFLFPKWKWLKAIFFLPFLFPSAAAALIWKDIFPNVSTVIPLYLLFLWKNTGICLILLCARISAVNADILEAAKLDGAGYGRVYASIILPYTMPVILFGFLFSIVNSFRIFRESYLYYGGNYPPEHSYTLQYYMNNNFLNLNYQALSTSGVLVTAIIIILVLFGLYLQKKVEWEL